MSRRAAQIGMRVVLADIDAARLEAMRSELSDAGAEVRAVRTDVRDADAVEALADAAYAAFGSVRLLVNNAGLESVGRLWETSTQTWQRMQRVNVDGVFHGIRSFVPRMGAQPGATYVANVASVAAVTSGTMNGAYYASKHAVLAMTESLYLEAREAFPRLSVSVVCPAAVATNIFDDALSDSVDEPATDAELGVMRKHLRENGITADAAAELILGGVAERRFWIATHPERFAEITARRARMLTDLTPPLANVPKEFGRTASEVQLG